MSMYRFVILPALFPRPKVQKSKGSTGQAHFPPPSLRFRSWSLYNKAMCLLTKCNLIELQHRLLTHSRHLTVQITCNNAFSGHTPASIQPTQVYTLHCSLDVDTRGLTTGMVDRVLWGYSVSPLARYIQTTAILGVASRPFVRNYRTAHSRYAQWPVYVLIW